MTDRAREARRVRAAERYARLKLSPDWESIRAKRNEKARRYQKEHRQSQNEYRRKWRDRNPEKVAAQRARYAPRAKQYWSEYYYSYGGRELSAMRQVARQERESRLFGVSPEAYALHRRKKREAYANRRKKQGLSYNPKPTWRIPDWAKKGQELLDRRSVYLYQNLTHDRQSACLDFARQANK